jgi:UDP-N-acetylmuramyl pentapeptide phosphotransferase/UDP-N-acetylglucosamine-1-phosphate transferase
LVPEEGARLGRRAVVPRVGGLAVVGAFAVAMLALPPSESWLPGPAEPSPLALLLAAVGLAAVGFAEDLERVSRQSVAAAQVLAVVLLFWSGYQVDDLAVPFWHEVPLGGLSLPFTLVWMLAMANVFDVVRGLDGLAGGLALVATLALLAAAAAQDRWAEVAVLAAVAGALAGFVRFNFAPARVFLGRCGSRPVGLVLGALAVSGRLKSPAALAVVVPILALVLPLLDAALPPGERPRLPHRAVLVVYGLGVGIATVTLVLTEGPPLAFSAAAAILLLAAGATTRGLGWWQTSATPRWLAARLAEGLRPSGDSTLRALEEDLAEVGELGAGWSRLCQAGWALGLVELHLTPRPGWEARLPERHSFAPDPTQRWSGGLVREATWSFELQAAGGVVAEMVARAPLSPTEFDPLRFVTLVERLVARHVDETAGARVHVAAPAPVPPGGAAE